MRADPVAPTTRHITRTAWPAMGSEAEAVVVGGTGDLLDRLRGRSADLEQRWSRFRDDSEVSALNRDPNAGLRMGADTRHLIREAAAGWTRTGGLFDPTVLPAVLATGYTHDFDTTLAPTGYAVTPNPPPGPPPGLAGVRIDGERVWLGVGVTLDPGGVGKGLAADLMAELAVEAGARGAMVSMGGDVATLGQPPDDRGWGVEVADVQGHLLATLALTGGGVATSSPARRRWRIATGTAHHLIDPRTGAPSRTDVQQVTVVAATAVDAEVLATAITVAGSAAAPGLLHGAAGLLVTTDGCVHPLGTIEEYLR